jgi:hypothetical protein
MDDRQFDGLTRWVVTSQTRRGALRTVAGSALGVALGLSALRGVDAALKPADAKCSSDTQCASGTCIKYGRCKKNGRLTGKCRCACDSDTECGTGRNCRNRACFSTCSPAGTCGADFQECGTGNCGCYTSTDAEQNCVFTGRGTCETDTCTTETDCPVGYVCSLLEVTGMEGCCDGKQSSCDAPCQAKSVTISASEATAASRDGQGGSRNGHASARH